jgi:predicted nucleic acid-binding protein
LAEIHRLGLFSCSGRLPQKLREGLKATTVFNYPQRLVLTGETRSLPVAVDYSSRAGAGRTFLASANVLGERREFLLCSGKSLEELKIGSIVSVFKEITIGGRTHENLVAIVPSFSSLKIIDEPAPPAILPPISVNDIRAANDIESGFRLIPKGFVTSGEYGKRGVFLNNVDKWFRDRIDKELWEALQHQDIDGISGSDLSRYCTIVANSLIGSKEGDMDLLVAQNVLSSEDADRILSRNANFNTTAFAQKVAVMLREYSENKLTRKQTEKFLRRLVPWATIESLKNDLKISLHWIGIPMTKGLNPREFLEAKIPLARKLERKFKISFSDAMFVVMNYTRPDAELEKILVDKIKLANELSETYELPFYNTMYIALRHKDAKAWLKEKVPLAEDLSEKHGITFYKAMYVLASINKAEAWLEKNVPAATDLSKKHGISFFNALTALLSRKNTAVWLDENMPLARKSSEKYGIPFCRAVEVFLRKKDSETWLKVSVPVARRYAKKYSISFSDSLVVFIGQGKPKAWLKKNVPLIRDLTVRYGITFTDAMFVVKGKKNAERWLEVNMPQIRKVSEERGLPFNDVLEAFLGRRSAPELVEGRIDPPKG